VINVVKRRGNSESFEPDKIKKFILWAVIDAGYTLEEKKEVINEISDGMIEMTPEKSEINSGTSRYYTK